MRPQIQRALFQRGQAVSFMAKKLLSKKQIETLVKKLSEKAKEDNMSVQKAFVFGSYAKNKVHAKSDLDLCFVSSKFKDTLKAEAYLRTKLHFLNLDYGIPIDIVAYRPEEFKNFSPLIYEIKKRGKEIKIR